MSIPPMVAPGALSTAVFVLIVAAVVAMIVAGTHFAGRRLGEGPGQVRRWTLGTALGLGAWLAITGALSGSGALESSSTPPRAMLLMIASNLVALGFALSPAGGRLVRGLPVAALVGFHAFRLPLELVLHAWYVAGTLPVSMTYAGRNLDIITGVLAALVALYARRAGASRPLIWLFNLVGLGLLINVASIAVLSSPFPFRVFMDDPPVLLIFHFPHGWIVPFCVAPALAGHVLLFRWLLRRGG